ncbi:DJ-1/PfpI family protein [Candidatus Woesearchaeota archaeon]|nr:DJ-1/PfpI family protein [Candidatus Woesearchaeota archaeon]MBW3006099.1 DJ-1/PfpI family protein [Candidatus Woesearchaeota archaeon]
MSKVLFVVAHDGFRDEECFEPKEVLKDHEVIVASTDTSPAKGALGGTITPDMTIDDALNMINEFDAVVFIGGPGANVYFDNPTAHKIAQNAKNVLAAICIAPVTLAKAGVLEGKKATVWDDGQGTQANILKENGANYVAEDVVVDGNLITANGPKAATKFGEAILKKLS